MNNYKPYLTRYESYVYGNTYDPFEIGDNNSRLDKVTEPNTDSSQNKYLRETSIKGPLRKSYRYKSFRRGNS